MEGIMDAASKNSAEVPKASADLADSLTSKANGVKVKAEAEEAFGSPAAAKTLDFGFTSATTPSTPVSLTNKITSDDGVDYDAFIKDTVMWKNIVRSVVYLVFGLLLISGACYSFNSSTPFITVACYAILAQIALNFMRVVVDPKIQERATYSDSAYTQWAIKQVTAVVRSLAAVHDAHLMSLQPMKTLQIIVGLWLLSIFAQYVGFFTLLGAVYALAFVIPKLYVLNKAKIDPVLADVYSKGLKQFNGMDLRIKAGLIIVPVLLLGYFSSRADMVIAAFVVLAYARTQFKDADVARGVKMVKDKTDFIQKTASKIGKQGYSVVETFLDKHELTPTPMKKKSQ